MERDLTVSEVLVDPLIAQLRRADMIGHAAFAQLMQSAARVHARQTAANGHEDHAEPFLCAIDAAKTVERCIR